MSAHHPSNYQEQIDMLSEQSRTVYTSRPVSHAPAVVDPVEVFNDLESAIAVTPERTGTRERPVNTSPPPEPGRPPGRPPVAPQTQAPQSVQALVVPWGDRIAAFKQQLATKLTIFAFWQTAKTQTKTSKKTGGWARFVARLQELMGIVVRDIPWWTGVFLTALIVFPVLRSHIIAIYGAAVGLVAIGFLFERTNLIRYGFLAGATLQIVQLIIKLFLLP